MSPRLQLIPRFDETPGIPANNRTSGRIFDDEPRPGRVTLDEAKHYRDIESCATKAPGRDCIALLCTEFLGTYLCKADARTVRQRFFAYLCMRHCGAKWPTRNLSRWREFDVSRINIFQLFGIEKMTRLPFFFFFFEGFFFQNFHRPVIRSKSHFLISKTIVSYVFFSVEYDWHLTFCATLSASREIPGGKSPKL